MSGAKPKIVVSKEVRPGLRRFISKRTVIPTVVLLVVGAGFGGYAIYRQLNKEKELPTINLDGQKYKVNLLTTPEQTEGEEQPATDRTEEIKKKEAAIKDTGGQPQDYLALAQLYLMQGDNDKALENYKKARKAANPKMVDYKSFVAGLDATIKALESMDKNENQ